LYFALAIWRIAKQLCKLDRRENPMNCRDAALAVVLLLGITLPAEAGIAVQAWGGVRGDGVDLFILTNAKGMQARITNYGAVITAIRMPGRDGKLTNVVQGFDSLADYTSADYIRSNGHYGSIIGRFANRIRGAKITLDGKSYALDPDKNGDLDQGGTMAYFRQVFAATPHDGAEPSLELRHTDPDGFMGFPGTVQVTVTYILTRDNVLRIDCRATTDKKTVINLINHSYFNLAGQGEGDVGRQQRENQDCRTGDRPSQRNAQNHQQRNQFQPEQHLCLRRHRLQWFGHKEYHQRAGNHLNALQCHNPSDF